MTINLLIFHIYKFHFVKKLNVIGVKAESLLTEGKLKTIQRLLHPTPQSIRLVLTTW